MKTTDCLTQEVRDLGFICSEGSGIESLGITRVLLLASWQSLGTECALERSRFGGVYRWMPNAECAKISTPQATTTSARTPQGAFIAAKVLALGLGVNTAPSGNYWLKPLGLGIAKRTRSDGQARDFLAVSTLSQVM
jgi:hypothetical protein